MKTRILLLAAIIAGAVNAAPLPEREVARIADAIYRAEGGSKARVPYGVLSVRVANAAEARRVCMNTIRNNHSRWESAGKPGDFIKYLGAKYCPPSADPTGHKNWVRNVGQLIAGSNNKTKGK